MGQHEIGCFGTRKELGIKPETLVVAALTRTWGSLKIERHKKANIKQNRCLQTLTLTK